MVVKRSEILAATVITFFLATFAFAAVPQTINYQGYLKNGTGDPVNGTVSLIFTLYNSPAKGIPVWQEPAKLVTVTNGVYSTTVGSATNPLTAPFDVPYYLGISVNGTELPLQPLTSVPYARRADTADTVPASAIANRSITLDKLASGVVQTWQSINSSTTANANTGYITSGSTPVNLTLPAAPAVGDIFSISGAGTGGWILNATGNQSIVSSTTGELATGAIWTPQTAAGARTWESIASSADGTKLAAVASGDRIYTSSDSGATWTAQGVANSWKGISSSADGTTLAAVALGNKIYTSGNSGVTWIERNYLGNWRAVTSSADGIKLAAVIPGNYIYTSGDSGVTWINQPSSALKQWLSIASSADGTRLIAGTGGVQGQIYTSTDTGVTWTPQASPIGKEWIGVASSADGMQLAAIAQGGQIYISVDGGVSWTARESNRQWSAITSSADGTKLAATVTAGTVYISIDSGSTWTTRESSRQWSAIASSTDGLHLAAAEKGGTIYTTIGSPGAPVVGTTWTVRTNSGVMGWETIASSADGMKLAAGGSTNFYIYTSSDAGATWTQRNAVPSSWVAISSSYDGVKLAALADRSNIHTSADSGATWVVRSNMGVWAGLASSADGTKLAAVNSVGRLQLSTDSGATWTEHWTAASKELLCIASSADGTRLVAGTGGTLGQIFTSSDSGITWTAQAGTTGRIWIGTASSANGMRLAAIAQGGQIYTSGDGGVTWIARENNRQWSAITSSADGTRLAATVSPGLIYVSNDAGVTWAARDNSRYWSSIAFSADGLHLAATDHFGYVYTSVEGVTNTIVGGARDAIQLQYTGNNQYQVLSYTPTPQIKSPLAADGSVVTSSIADGAVTASKLAIAAVNSAALANSSVTDVKIAAGGVITASLADTSVTGPKIADGAVTDSKISGTIDLSKRPMSVYPLFLSSGTLMNPISTDYKFAGQPVTITTTRNQKLIGTAVAGGYIYSGTATVYYGLCYAAAGSQTPYNFSSNPPYASMTTTASTLSISSSVDLPAGTWDIGFCVKGSVPQIMVLSINGWIMVTN